MPGDVNANPDTRPLPDGWVEEFDQKRQKWFYKQTNVNPPRVSYVHPLGPLRPAVTIKRNSSSSPTASQHNSPPIASTRDEVQTPTSPAQNTTDAGSYARQMYRHAAASGVTSSSTSSATSSKISLSTPQPNLPAHMRRMLSDPPLQTASDSAVTPNGAKSTPAQLIAAQTREAYSNRRMSLGASPTSPMPSSAGSGSDSGSPREIFTSLQGPSHRQPLSGSAAAHGGTSPLYDSRAYGSEQPLPLLPGQIPVAQGMSAISPTSPAYTRRMSYRASMGPSAPPITGQPSHHSTTEYSKPLSPLSASMQPSSQHQQYPPACQPYSNAPQQYAPQNYSPASSQAQAPQQKSAEAQYRSQQPGQASALPSQSQSPPPQQHGQQTSAHSGPSAMQILKGGYQVAKIGLKVYHAVDHITHPSTAAASPSAPTDGAGIFGLNVGGGSNGGGGDFEGLLNGNGGGTDFGTTFGSDNTSGGNNTDFTDAFNGLAALNLGQANNGTGSDGNDGLAALLLQAQGMENTQSSGSDDAYNALMMQAGMQDGNTGYLDNSTAPAYNPGF